MSRRLPVMSYLSDQQVSNTTNCEVVGAALGQTLFSAGQQLRQEVGVKLQQLVQTREHAMDNARLQHHFFLQPAPVHALHDSQRPHVMELCLDEL